MTRPDVLIVGSGPAGIHAAIALRRMGHSPLVLEREAELGGVPRWCHHYTFPCPVKKRLFTGPGYAGAWVNEAEQAGVAMQTETTVLRLHPTGPTLHCTSPQGPQQLDARAILLATGAREAHRHQRLIAGDRPRGIFTTASLFQSIYRNATLPGKRFVVFGAEDVSYSCVNTILAKGGTVAAVVEPTAAMRSWPAAQFYFERLRGIPHYFAVNEMEIHGRGLVSEVAFAGTQIACDAVVFTGGFTPNAELMRGADLRYNLAARGPGINQRMQTSAPWIFAAGNCLRGVVPGYEAASEGRLAAASIAAYLQQPHPSLPETKVEVEHPLAYCCPDRIIPTPGGMERIAIWPAAHLKDATLQAILNGKPILTSRLGSIHPGRRIQIPIASLPLRDGGSLQFTVTGTPR